MDEFDFPEEFDEDFDPLYMGGDEEEEEPEEEEVEEEERITMAQPIGESFSSFVTQSGTFPIETTFLIPREQYITSAYMTPFEKAKVVGIRAWELSHSVTEPRIPLDEAEQTLTITDVARKEFERNLLDDYIVRRYFPNRFYEEYKVGELIK